jgi:hypothetical protein
MTEHDWLTATDPQVMLRFVQGGKANERKLQLFAVACVRRVWNLLHDENEEFIRDTVEATERFADGAMTLSRFSALVADLGSHPIIWADNGWDLHHAATPDLAPYASLEFGVLAANHAIRDPATAMRAAQYAAFAEATASFIDHGPDYAAHLEEHVARLGSAGATAYAATFRSGADLWRHQVLTENGWQWETEMEVERANGYAVLAALADANHAQTNLLRDIFGPLPFRTPRFGPGWRTPLVLSLAQTAYEERVAPAPSRPGWLVLEPVRLLVLADALEEAGADEPEILEHLRGPGEHVRGCWCLDLILSKQ